MNEFSYQHPGRYCGSSRCADSKTFWTVYQDAEKRLLREDEFRCLIIPRFGQFVSYAHLVQRWLLNRQLSDDTGNSALA